ncbi:MAG: CYTH domain-containing protein [Spirochaetaceae bacterium]|jgi:class 3 adenylate cyclase|nr:CYTH domain-containing protein [Spirochaetaceae bacterium]
MDNKKVENEIKLSSVINSQLKMINMDNREEIVKKILFVCGLLGIKTEESADSELVDDYYDTGDGYLNQKKFTIRKRAQTPQPEGNRQIYLTIKSPSPHKDTVGMARNEYEDVYDEAELDRIISDTGRIVEIIMKEFGENLPINGKLSNQLTIKNMRTCIPISTDTDRYTLCLDKYYFFSLHSPDIRDYSEYRYEIEIEKNDGFIGEDQQLAKLHGALKELFDYTDSDSSKYKAALEWMRNPAEAMPRIFTVMFDIVGYSKKSAALQKNNIQLLNRSLKQAIKSVFGEEHRFVYLPTGDGLILIMDNYFKEILPLCYHTQRIIRDTNSALFGDEKVEFRTGLNVGNVFKYSDINGSLNFAGDGINMVERVTGIGNAGHILATEEFYNQAKDLNVTWRNDLHGIGEYTVKHGKKIKVFNIYNREAGTGNPHTPEKTV